MGTSTDAELFYGYCWQVSEEEESSEQFVREDDGLYEWATEVLRKRGFVSPFDREDVDVMNPVDPNQPYASRGFTEIGRVLYEEWSVARRAVEEEFGVEYFTHGGPEWRCPVIAIKASRVTAWRGSPKQIDVETLDHTVGWDAKLDAWCAEMGIVLDPETKGEEWDGPCWFLASDWNH